MKGAAFEPRSQLGALDKNSVARMELRNRHIKATEDERPTSPQSDNEQIAPGMQDQKQVMKAETKLNKFLKRLFAGLFLFGGFTFTVWAGAMWVVLMIMSFQVFVFRELVNVRYAKYQNDKKIKSTNAPLFRTLQYMWFIVAMLYSYGTFVRDFARDSKELQWLSEYMHFHFMVTFALFSIAFILSIVTMSPGHIRYQVGHLSWTIVAIVIVCGQMIHAPFMIHVGIFWFFFPAFMVITNDCAAYVCGMLFGKKIINRPFLPLSPNKTWEGFIGATIITLLFAWYSSDYFSDWSNFVCPAGRLTLSIHPDMSCPEQDLFVQQDIEVPRQLRSIMIGYAPEYINAKPVQLHGLLIGLVASTVAPFGGFMASAIKRANGVKDFDSVIPGHGGFTDRFDCQMLISLYVWVHYTSLILHYVPPRERILNEIALLESIDREYVLSRLALLLNKTVT